MSHRNHLISVLCFWLYTLLPLAAAAPAPKPNIIVILVDDMGFSDIGCYGGEIPTPNLDALAAGGLRFTQFYNAGRCCPSRASLLSGLYAHQTGMGLMTENHNLPGYLGHLNDSCVTLAEVLGSAGYFTAMAGKWHLGQLAGVTPSKRGFQRSLNAVAGGFYFDDGRPETTLFLNGEKIVDREKVLPKNWYSTDLWTDFGLKFITEARAQKKPYFLYLAHNAPHFPLQAPQAEIDQFRGKYATGWGELRKKRHARQLELGIVGKECPLSPAYDEVPDWNSLPAAEKSRYELIMSIYAACVAHMDTSVGRLVANLREHGELENTLILFMSDNGACAELPGKERSQKAPLGQPGSTVFETTPWANLSNTPLRLFKRYNHEGGIATPLIVHWPARIHAKGELRTEPAHLIDIMPTCVEASGASYPLTFNNKAIQPMEGLSLFKVFENQPLVRKALYWEHLGHAAVRVGDWKLVRLTHKKPWELYNIKADRCELHNLAGANPKQVQELSALWETWALRAQVKPGPKIH